MTCEQIKERLPELLELLDSAESLDDRQVLEEHVAGCDVCRSTLDGWKRLREQARSLEIEQLPQRDLWTGIEKDISRTGPGTAAWWLRPVPLGLVAASLTVLISGLSLVRWAANYQAVRPAAVSSATAGSRAADLARYEDRVLSTRKELIAVAAAREAEFEPELAAAIGNDVRVLNEAIGQIRLALEEHPDSHRLNLVLAKRYRQEADLLHRLLTI